MIEMSSEQHDEYAADSQFITHLTGRILWQQNLAPTPIDTKGFQTVLQLVDNTCSDSFDLFFGLYYYNEHAASQLQRVREALAKVERQLAAKEVIMKFILDFVIYVEIISLIFFRVNVNRRIWLQKQSQRPTSVRNFSLK
jgi:prephenate dehydrogenase